MYLYPPSLVLFVVAEAVAACPDAADPCGCPASRDYPSTRPSFPDGMSSADFEPDFECVPRLENDASCEPYQAYVPNGTLEQPELFLFLHGLNSSPESTAHIPVIAAYAGHKALSIAWDAQELVATRCVSVGAGLGGVCADECSETMRYSLTPSG